MPSVSCGFPAMFTTAVLGSSLASCGPMSLPAMSTTAVFGSSLQSTAPRHIWTAVTRGRVSIQLFKDRKPQGHL